MHQRSYRTSSDRITDRACWCRVLQFLKLKDIDAEMWSANGLSRTAKKKRGLVEDFLKKKMKSFRMLAQYVASEYTWAFQKIYKERTPRFFF